jgi:serine protease Do
MKDTPASSAGVLRRDVITKFNGTEVKDHDELPLMVARTAVGATVSVEVIRNGRSMTLSVKLAELSEKAAVEPQKDEPDALGLTVEALSEELATSLGLTVPYGIRITGVVQGSLAEAAGLGKDDIIEEFAGQRFRNGAAWRDFIGGEFAAPIKSEKLFLGLVRRKQGSRYFVVKRVVSKPADARIEP